LKNKTIQKSIFYLNKKKQKKSKWKATTCKTTAIPTGHSEHKTKRAHNLNGIEYISGDHKRSNCTHPSTNTNTNITRKLHAPQSPLLQSPSPNRTLSHAHSKSSPPAQSHHQQPTTTTTTIHDLLVTRNANHPKVAQSLRQRQFDRAEENHRITYVIERVTMSNGWRQ
jgi:hypothetical protein